VLTQGQNGTSTLSTIAQETFATNRIYGLGSAMAILTFIVVMIVSSRTSASSAAIFEDWRRTRRWKPEPAPQAATRAHGPEEVPAGPVKVPWWM
jgi:hypothetical protein